MTTRLISIGAVSSLVTLAWQVVPFEGFPDRGLRVETYPTTFISSIELDLTNPPRVRLTWAGPEAAKQPKGPFRASPGRGWGTNDCNDVIESNCLNSRCTPKGFRTVEGLREHLKDHPECRYSTVIDSDRGISFHSHIDVPDYPSSAGCIRMTPYAAQLIYDNCCVGVTEVVVDGEWALPEVVSASEAT